MTDSLLALAELSDEDRVWAILPDRLHAMLAAAEAGRAPQQPPTPIPAGRSDDGTALIPVYGPISRRPTFWSMFFGGTSTEAIAHALRAAIADRSVRKVILHVDSPGGDVAGIPELADEIYRARSKKPITAFVDTTAASAAYWLASQATELIVTPSGQVGSIGVFGLHLDQSRLLGKAGITPTFISAGKYKTEGNPLEELGDEAKAEIQRRVDAFHDMFVRDVARGRGLSVDTVRRTFGEGRMVLARDAVRRGMADDGDAPPSGAASSSAGSFAAAPPVFTYTEVREHQLDSSYRDAARTAFWSTVLEEKLHGREPSLHFFCPEEPDDDADRRRITADVDISGRAYPDANGDRGEIWVRTGLSMYRDASGRSQLEQTVRHEVRHIAQPDHVHADEDLAERDATDYAQRDPLSWLVGDRTPAA